MTIPSPTMLHYRVGRKAVDAMHLPVDREMFSPISFKLIARRCRAFADAGCRYLQLDDTTFAICAIPSERRRWLKDRGDDPEQLPHIYADMINGDRRQAGRHGDRMHLCRGNFRSTFMASGGYEPVAEVLFNEIESTAISWNTTTSAPAASSRCASCPRARSAWCSASSPRKPARSKARTDSSAASTRRRNSSPLDQLASRRNAALPPPRKAMCWPRTSNGRSCG